MNVTSCTHSRVTYTNRTNILYFYIYLPSHAKNLMAKGLHVINFWQFQSTVTRLHIFHRNVSNGIPRDFSTPIATLDLLSPICPHKQSRLRINITRLRLHHRHRYHTFHACTINLIDQQPICTEDLTRSWRDINRTIDQAESLVRELSYLRAERSMRNR